MNESNSQESNIRKYAILMRELGLTGLEVKEENCVVRLERTETVAAAAPATTPPEQPAEAADRISFCAPMVGVFYAASAENVEPFVKVGDTVRKGDTLCIIEAMKLMNEIQAEEDGVIAEVCAVNGQVVDYGCELFRLRRNSL